jgi:hypothetical protein
MSPSWTPVIQYLPLHFPILFSLVCAAFIGLHQFLPPAVSIQ